MRLITTVAISTAGGYGVSTWSGSPAAASSGATGIVLRYPTHLAVGPDGNLYFGDTGLDRILERLPSGQFRVIAGNGHRGFAGDGRSALDVELESIGDMTFAKNGTLYFADGNRIRAIAPIGRITTIVGDGSTSPIAITDGTPALKASVGSTAGPTIGPDGDLYFTGGSNQVLRLTSHGTIDVVASSGDFANLGGVEQLYPAELVFDGLGDLYVSTGNAFRLVELTKAGRVLYLGPLRRGGGSPAALASGPGGRVCGDWQNSIVRIDRSRVKVFLTFQRGSVPRVSFTFLPDDLAVGPDGTIYTDTIANNGWTDTTAVIAISPDRHVTTLWARNEPAGYASL